MNLGTILRDLEIVNLKVLVLYNLLVASLGALSGSTRRNMFLSRRGSPGEIYFMNVFLSRRDSGEIYL